MPYLFLAFAFADAGGYLTSHDAFRARREYAPDTFSPAKSPLIYALCPCLAFLFCTYLCRRDIFKMATQIFFKKRHVLLFLRKSQSFVAFLPPAGCCRCAQICQYHAATSSNGLLDAIGIVGIGSIVPTAKPAGSSAILAAAQLNIPDICQRLISFGYRFNSCCFLPLRIRRAFSPSRLAVRRHADSSRYLPARK